MHMSASFFVKKRMTIATFADIFDIKPGIGMWDMLKTMKLEAMTNMISGIQDGFIESLNARLIKIKK